MDWANERWVRLYTRDTTTWKMLDWRARTVLMHMLRKVDRAGVLEVGDTGTMGLAAVLELPLEVVEPGVERLLHPRLRVVVETPTAYVLPKYLDAQEAVQTTNHRSAEYRARKRDYALAAAKPAIAELVRLPAPEQSSDGVTPRDGAVTKRDAGVTRGHATSPVLDLEAFEQADLPAETDPPISPIVTKRDADITTRDETITRHHATSQLVTPILSDPKDLSPSARAIPSSTEQAPELAQQPTTPDATAMSPPAPVREDLARTQPTATPATRSPDPKLDAIVQPAAAPAFDPGAPLASGRLAEATYRQISDARIAIAVELGLPAPIPFPESTPSTQTRGLVELRARIREEGAQAAMVCDRVVENLIAQAREERHIDWLSESVFGDKAWPRAKDWRSKKRAGPQAAPPRPRDRDPPAVTVPDAVRAEIAASMDDTRALLKRLTSNDDDTSHQPRRRKAAT